MVEFQPGIKILHQAGKVTVPADLLLRQADYCAYIRLHNNDSMKKLKTAQEEAPELLKFKKYART